MAWTYDPTQLSTSDLFQVRFLIGDTETNDPLLTDEEIQFLLTDKESVRSAAIACCENLVAKFTRQADYTLGPYSIKATQKAQRYRYLANDLKKNSASLSGPLYATPTKVIFDVGMMQSVEDSHVEEDE